MKTERLSSLWTNAYKFVVAPLWLGFGGLGLATLHESGGGEILPALAALWLAISLFLLWLAVRIVHVTLDGEEIVVGGARWTERIALRDVEGVSGTSLLDPELVWIRLRRPAAFGSRIVFIPRRRGFRPFTPHPVVAHLTALITQHQTPGLPPPLEWGRGAGSRAAPRIAAAVVLLGVVGLLVAGGLRFVASGASPYHAAVQAARTHPVLITALGEPIRADWPVDARVRWHGDSAATDFVVPLSGPRDRAELHVRAEWQDGEWSFSELRAVFENGRFLDLIDAGPPPPEPPGELL